MGIMAALEVSLYGGFPPVARWWGCTELYETLPHLCHLCVRHHAETLQYKLPYGDQWKAFWEKQYQWLGPQEEYARWWKSVAVEHDLT